MRTLPQGTIISRPRGRIKRLLLCLLVYQWVVLVKLWRSAWVGLPAGTPGIVQEQKKITKKNRRKIERDYQQAQEKARELQKGK